MSPCHGEDHEFESRMVRQLAFLPFKGAGPVAQMVVAKDWKSLCRRFDPGLGHHLRRIGLMQYASDLFSLRIIILFGARQKLTPPRKNDNQKVTRTLNGLSFLFFNQSISASVGSTPPPIIACQVDGFARTSAYSPMGMRLYQNR